MTGVAGLAVGAALRRIIPDGKRAALLKIIAGMAGVEYGDWVRRDQHRAIWRLRWMVVGTTALVLAFAIFGTALFFQRREALAQKVEALRQRNMARVVRGKRSLKRLTDGFAKAIA